MPRTKLFDEEKVLKKAMELFWQKGYNATSIGDLVEHTGINRASLYDTFGSKKALFDKAFQLYKKSGQQRISYVFQHHKDSVKKGLHELFCKAIEESFSTDYKGCFAVNTTIEFIPEDQSLDTIISDNKCNIENQFQEYLKLGVTQGEISKDKDLRAIAAFLYTFYSGLRVVTKVNPDKKQLEIIVQTALSILD